MDQKKIDEELMIHVGKMLAKQGVEHAPRDLATSITSGIKDAISDIRQKLVEEPWFGKSLDAQSGSSAPVAPTPKHKAWEWKPADVPIEKPVSPEPTPDEKLHKPDRGIDI